MKSLIGAYQLGLEGTDLDPRKMNDYQGFLLSSNHIGMSEPRNSFSRLWNLLDLIYVLL